MSPFYSLFYFPFYSHFNSHFNQKLMKYSRISVGRDGKEHLSFVDSEQFKLRIQQDANDFLVSQFRLDLPKLDTPRSFRRYGELARFCPAVELMRQPNGAITFRRYNGLVVLDVKGVVGSAALEQVKARAMSFPFTEGAFVGASGQTVKLLVRVARANGSVPEGEAEAAAFYAEAHRELVPLYNRLIAPYNVVAETPGLMHSFLIPLDDAPRFRAQETGAPYMVAGTVGVAGAEPTDALPAVPPPLHEERDEDWERFEIYERTYGECVRRARELSAPERGVSMDRDFLTELSRQLALAGLPQEEAFEHVWRHLRFRPGADAGVVRAIVEATYDTELDDHHPALPTPGKTGDVMRRLIRKLEQHYVFRYNTIMGYTEMRRNISAHAKWVPVTSRVVADLTIEAQLDDIPAWNRDVQRYVESTRIRNFSLIDDYLFNTGTWDGYDHIRALARTVPTDTAEWPDWFHTWFLAMVAQWTGRNTRWGNALVPLLVSRQGNHKSDFCRQLLPPELRAWGYTDSLSMGEERPVLLAMTQMLLVNLDEFNQISAKKQEGFLKNILQLPTVKAKRPYGRHVEDIKRLASFIATTNQADVLSDPSGSRRFIGILVNGDIDTSQTPNYRQLMAQAMAELKGGARYWLDAEETARLMAHNRSFQLQSDAMSLFHEYFRVATADELQAPTTQWLSSAAILKALKNRAGGVLKQLPSLNKLSRELGALPGINSRYRNGITCFAVAERE